jgi:hypothetical protein
MSIAAAVMTPQEVASRMNELFKENKWQQVQEELYSDDCESIEPAHAPGLQTVKGKEAIKQKGIMFQNMIEEVHGGWSSDVLVAGNYLTCAMGMECTMKGMGRIKMDEVCVYEVKDGKVVKEQFFF